MAWWVWVLVAVMVSCGVFMIVAALVINSMTPRNNATWHEHERSKRFFDGR
jgi:putative effector of murein hydrolase LrgA (UPF0299 family)